MEKFMEFSEWAKEYKPIPNECDGYFLFDTCGGDYKKVLEASRANPLTIWTELDIDGKSVIQNGKHFVNRLAYYITEIPFGESDFIEVNLDED